MSNKKNKERAAQGETFRSGETKELRRARCIVQGCPRTYFVEEGKPPLCADCQDFLMKLVFFLPRLKFEAGKTPGGIIVPGHEQFNPTLGGKPVNPIIAKQP